jgi:hypothetical protein
LAAFVDELIPEYAFFLYKSETVPPRIAIAEWELSTGQHNLVKPPQETYGEESLHSNPDCVLTLVWKGVAPSPCLVEVERNNHRDCSYPNNSKL